MLSAQDDDSHPERRTTDLTRSESAPSLADGLRINGALAMSSADTAATHDRDGSDQSVRLQRETPKCDRSERMFSGLGFSSWSGPRRARCMPRRSPPFSPQQSQNTARHWTAKGSGIRRASLSASLTATEAKAAEAPVLAWLVQTLLQLRMMLPICRVKQRGRVRPTTKERRARSLSICLVDRRFTRTRMQRHLLIRRATAQISRLTTHDTSRARRWTHSPVSVLVPTVPPHVLIYGGGAMGVLHATLLQLRLEHARRTVPNSALASGSVTVLTSQSELARRLSTSGVEVELLRPFVQSHREWMPAQDVKHADATSHTHITLKHAVRIAAATAAPSRSTSMQPYTHILLCTKGRPPLNEACNQIRALFSGQLKTAPAAPLAAVCLLMNGLGHKEHMIARMQSLSEDRALVRAFERRLVLATTTSGARLMQGPAISAAIGEEFDELRLRHGGNGSTVVMANEFERESDAACSPSQSMHQLFTLMGLDSSVASAAQAASMLHTKLLINCVINPLTGVHGVRNGELLTERFRREVLYLTLETVRVLHALGIDLAPVSSEQQEAAGWQVADAVRLALAELEPQPPEIELQVSRGLFHVFLTCFRTQHNFSSMYTDLHRRSTGLPAPSAMDSAPRVVRRLETEVEHITGYLLQRAREMHIPADQLRHTQQIYQAVKRAEEELNRTQKQA